MNFDGSYKSLLAGVSQQVPSARLDGQLSMQENMLSDIVSGLRRRPGVRALSTIPDFSPTPSNTLATYVEGASGNYNTYINSDTGEMVVCGLDGTLLSRITSPYLVATSVSAIRETAVSGTSWLLNTERVPALGPVDTTKLNPVYDGWFYIRTGAFNKEYQVRFEWGGVVHDITYTTPAGANPAEVLQSTPEGVATNLVTAITTGALNTLLDAYRIGAYVFVTRKNKSTGATAQTNVTSPSGLSFIVTSGSMSVNLLSDLPAKLPSQANGAVMSVGTSDLARSYYRWVHERSLWVETGNYASAATITNMPISYTISSAGVVSLATPVFNGRLAGDDENNPYPGFVGVGLTGLSSFQGRLVLLAGSTVNMSAAKVPTNFMRSTTSALRDDDAIETGSGSIAAASFEYGVQFNKDLVLIAATHQAIVPGGTTGITPANALVSLISKQAVDTHASPVVVGRTLMYSVPTTEAFFGIGELLPSAYSNSQYMAQNLTDHIPRYMPGRIRQIASSSTISSAMFTSTTDYRGVLVHDYLWAGEERPHMAWHRWSFPVDVVSIHSAKDQIMFAFAVGTGLVVCAMDVNSSRFIAGGSARPYIDIYSQVAVVGNTFTLPVHLRDVTKVGRLVATQTSGTLAGEPVGIEGVNTATWVATTVRSFPAGTLYVGWSYTSAFAPTPPVMKDKNGNAINTNKVTLTRYLMNVQGSGSFTVTISDQYGGGYSAIDSAMRWSSAELGLGRPLVSGMGTVTIPCRSLAQSTQMVVSTDSVRELNVVDLEFTLRTNIQRQRI